MPKGCVTTLELVSILWNTSTVHEELRSAIKQSTLPKGQISGCVNHNCSGNTLWLTDTVHKGLERAIMQSEMYKDDMPGLLRHMHSPTHTESHQSLSYTRVFIMALKQESALQLTDTVYKGLESTTMPKVHIPDYLCPVNGLTQRVSEVVPTS